MSTNGEPSETKTPAPAVGSRSRWLNPYWSIGLAVLCVPVAEMLLKRGAMASVADAGGVAGNGVNALASRWTWFGIAVYIINFLCWLQALRHLPLHLAFGLMSSVQVLVPLGCWWFLGETISPGRWCGILIVLVGITLTAAQTGQAEEHL